MLIPSHSPNVTSEVLFLVVASMVAGARKAASGANEEGALRRQKRAKKGEAAEEDDTKCCVCFKVLTERNTKTLDEYILCGLCFDFIENIGCTVVELKKLRSTKRGEKKIDAEMKSMTDAQDGEVDGDFEPASVVVETETKMSVENRYPIEETDKFKEKRGHLPADLKIQEVEFKNAKQENCTGVVIISEDAEPVLVHQQTHKVGSRL